MNKLQEKIQACINQYNSFSENVFSNKQSAEFFINQIQIKNIEAKVRTVISKYIELHKKTEPEKVKEICQKAGFSKNDIDENLKSNFRNLDVKVLFQNAQKFIDEISNEFEEKLKSEEVGKNGKKHSEKEIVELTNLIDKKSFVSYHGIDNVIMSLTIANKDELTDEYIDQIFADSHFIDKKEKLNINQMFNNKDIDLSKLNIDILSNVKILIENRSILKDNGIKINSVIESYQKTISNILKEQKYNLHKEECKKLIDFINSPMKVLKEQYPELSIPQEFYTSQTRDYDIFDAARLYHENNMRFSIEKFKNDDINVSDDDIIVSKNETNYLFFNYNKKYSTNISQDIFINDLKVILKADDMQSALRQYVKECYNAMFEDVKDIAKNDIVSFTKEFCTIINLAIEDSLDFDMDNFENLEYAGFEKSELANIQRETMEKYRPKSINEHYYDKYRKEFDSGDIAFSAKEDVRKMLNDSYRRALDKNDRGYQFNDSAAQKESAGILKALINHHENRPSNFWWKHPIKNLSEYFAIRSIKNQILESGCKKQTLDSYLKSQQIHDENYLQVLSDIEVFESDGFTIKEHQGERISVNLSEDGEELSDNEIKVDDLDRHIENNRNNDKQVSNDY